MPYYIASTVTCHYYYSKTITSQTNVDVYDCPFEASEALLKFKEESTEKYTWGYYEEISEKTTNTN